MIAVATVAAAMAVLIAGARWHSHARMPHRSEPSGAAPRTVRRASPTTTAHDWASMLDALATEVRAGSTLSTAWLQALERHPTSGRAVRAGRPLDETLHHGAGSPDEAVVLQVAGAAAAMGGPVAITIDAGAALLRERAAARADAIAHAAQARLSARVLTIVPLAFAAWSALTSASFRAGIATAAGAASVVIGTALNAVGWWWMRALVTRAAP